MNIFVARILHVLVVILVTTVAVGCHSNNSANEFRSTGNPVQDYFHRNHYAFPFHVDTSKPVCRIEDSLRIFGTWDSKRARLAKQAGDILRTKFVNESAVTKGDLAYAVFPVVVYFIDSPDCWYRVQLKEYSNNKLRLSAADAGGQLCDSGRIVTRTRNVELLINEDGSLEYQCDQEL